MASKTFYGTVTGTSSSHYSYKVELSSVLNKAENYSDVTCKSYIRRVDYLEYDYRSYNTGGTAEVTHTCEGETSAVTYTAYYDTRADLEYDLLFQNTWRVDHNSNGTKDVEITSVFVSNAASGMTGASAITNFVLDTNPRGSVIGEISTFNVEDTLSIPITKYSESFTDTIVLKYATTTIKTISDYEGGDPIQLTEDEILNAYNAMGTNMSGTFTVESTTLSGTATVGTDTKDVTGTVAGTVYINLGGVWKRALPHYNHSGIWKRCVAYRNDGGQWKRCVG